MAIWKGPHNLSQGSKGDFTARLDDKVASLASWLMEVNTLSQGLLPRTGSGGSTVTRMAKTNGLLSTGCCGFLPTDIQSEAIHSSHTKSGWGFKLTPTPSDCGIRLDV